jgi:hypothetical protein
MSNENFRSRVARWLDPSRGGSGATGGHAANPGTIPPPSMPPPGGPSVPPNPAMHQNPAMHPNAAAHPNAGPAAGHPMGPFAGPATGPAMSPARGTGTGAEPAAAVPRSGAEARKREVWPEICERFALQMLGHAEHLRPSLDRLEADENDEERLKLLYEVDHSVTRMRRAARDLRILAGIEDGELGGYTSSLVDVIRAAESSIEHYPKVTIGRVVDLAVVPYASDDFSSLLAALLDNATNYSPSTVIVSAHLLDSGSVMMRVEDNGIGIPPAHLEVLNAALAGPVPDVNDRTGKHTGFPVVHRLARKHGVGVRLASRPETGGPGGTIAMVTIPADLLCEVPDDEPVIGGATEPMASLEAPATPYAGGGPSPRLSVARPSRFAEQWRLPAPPPAPAAPAPDDATAGGLPRRTRTSLRGDEAGRSRASGRNTTAGAHSFADDLSAFAGGQTGPQSEPGRHEGVPSAGRAEQEQPEGESR